MIAVEYIPAPKIAVFEMNVEFITSDSPLSINAPPILSEVVLIHVMLIRVAFELK